MINFKNIHTIYFLGVGGIGMSALARYFKSEGKSVFGYDKTPTVLTEQLIKEGIQVQFETTTEKLPSNIDLVIYTPAISSDNKLFIELSKQYKLYKRSEILGFITKNTFTIGVAGTHGKTTISTLIAHVLKESSKGCTAFLGGISKNYNSNYLYGKNTNNVVVEADEFDRSFLTLHPNIAVVTSMDADHLDVYGEANQLQKSFQEYVNKIDANGLLINKKGVNLNTPKNCKTVTYSVNSEGDYYATNIQVIEAKYQFDLVVNGELFTDFKINLPGRHNVENTIAAIAVCHNMGLDIMAIKKSLLTFKGIKRRFEYIINTPELAFIDDYAHHPTELKAAILSAKEMYPNKTITGIFQPHLFSRTRDFADEFAASLSLLDEVVLLDIYPAREQPIVGINSQMLLNKIDKENKVLYSKQELVEHIADRKLEVLMTLGAGDIDKLIAQIKEKIEQKILN